MKKSTLSLLFFILLSNQLCQAQYISFDELLLLRAKELDEVNDFLIKKKWEIDNAKEGDFFDYNRATWAFNRNRYYEDSDKANAWFTYFYSDGSTNIIRYMTTSSNHYDLIKARIKALSFKLTDKTIEENGLAFTYINGQRSVKVKTDKDEDGVSRFVFTITKKTIPTIDKQSYSTEQEQKENTTSHSTSTTTRQAAKPKIGQVQDIDGNVYITAQIGTQTWMTENLKSTKFNDGTKISLVTNNDSWSKLTNPAYCLYDNNIQNKNLHGVLYNYYTIESNKLCPRGWSIPSQNDFKILTDYLSPNASWKMKSLTGWDEDGNGNNLSNFNGQPSGVRTANGEFGNVSINGYWWLNQNEASESEAPIFNLSYDNNDNNWNDVSSINTGLSVRCIKD